METQSFTNIKDQIKRQTGKEATLLPLLGVAVAAFGVYNLGRWLLAEGSEIVDRDAQAGTIVDESGRPDVVDEASRESFPASDAPSW